MMQIEDVNLNRRSKGKRALGWASDMLVVIETFATINLPGMNVEGLYKMDRRDRKWERRKKAMEKWK